MVLPVSIESGVAFSDYRRMQRKEHCLFESRSPNPPSWAVNLRELSLLLARYMELRAGIIFPRIDSPEKRIVHAHQKILLSMPSRIATLDRLIAERMQSTDQKRRRVLEIQTRTLDSRLCVEQRGPSLIVGVIFYFFRCGYTSPETALALKNIISPQAVRQIAFRLQRLWQRMQSGQDRKPKPNELRKAKRRAYYHLIYKSTALANQKSTRAAETPEQRETRLQYHRDYYYANRERIRAQQKEEQDRRREERRFAYANMTPEQRAAKKAYDHEWNRTHRAERAAYKKKEYSRLTPAEKENRRLYQKGWRATHRPQIAATRARYLAKKSRVLS